MKFNFLWTTPSAGAPIVSIASYGISFNSMVIEILGRPARVLLGFDEKELAIGVKPINEGGEDPRTYKFADRERQGTVRIGNRDFLRYVSSKTGIDLKKTTKFLANWDDEDQILIVDLKTPLESSLIDEQNEEDEN